MLLYSGHKVSAIVLNLKRRTTSFQQSCTCCRNVQQQVPVVVVCAAVVVVGAAVVVVGAAVVVVGAAVVVVGAAVKHTMEVNSF